MDLYGNAQQNKMNNFIINHPIGEDKAKAIRKNLLKSSQYFSIYNVEYLVEPKPTYIQKQPLQQKQSLSIPKQMEYARGTVKQYIDQQYLQNILISDYQDRGLVQNHKNKSLIYKNLLIYASDFHLKSITLGIGKFDPPQNNISQQFPERIFEIAKYQENLIIIRCRYWVFLFDIQKYSLKKKIRFKEEVTTVNAFKNGETIFATTFDQKQYKLYEWNLIQDSLSLIRSYQSFWSAHSATNLNRREFIIGLANKIIIEDTRTNQVCTLKTVMQVGNDRYTSLVQLCHSMNLFAVGRAKYIDIFDIRNSYNSLLSARHFCQQSPPSCLISLNWKHPILIAYSPSQLGSSLLLSIDAQAQQQDQQGLPLSLYQHNPFTPTLLFDSGKIYQGLHPKTISPIVDGDALTLIHIDSCDGISMEILKRSEKNSEIYHLRSNEKQAYPQQPCKQWCQNKNLQSFLCEKKSIMEDSLSGSSEESIQESQIFMKKNNYCSLDKFRNKIFQQASASEGKKQNQNEFQSTYFSESQGEENWAQIIRYAGKNNNQTNITQQLLNYLQQQWKY